MTDIVIQAEGVGKKYTTGHQTERGRDVARDVLLIRGNTPEETLASTITNRGR